jgi:hypothetical protein
MQPHYTSRPPIPDADLFVRAHVAIIANVTAISALRSRFGLADEGG